MDSGLSNDQEQCGARQGARIAKALAASAPPSSMIGRTCGAIASEPCACRKLDPHILVMQSAKDRTAEYEANRLDGAGNRRILVQGQVRTRLIVVAEVAPQQMMEMALAKDNHVVMHSRRIEPISRSAYPFCHGDRGDMGRSRMPMARTRRTNTSL